MSHSDPERLNDFVDGTLGRAERLEVESHLDTCPECEQLVSELRAVRRHARALPHFEPPEKIWRAVEEGIRTQRPQSSHFQTGLAVAAALVLGVSLWIALGSNEPSTSNTNELVDMVGEELRAAESHYENAIGGLEQIIEQNDGALPPELDQTLADNLDLIESAIDESRNAIAQDPDSDEAKESLLEAFRRKLGLLQNTILLINEVRKGDGENALDLIDEMREDDDPSSNPI